MGLIQTVPLTFTFLTNHIFLEGQLLCDSIIQIFESYRQLVDNVLALGGEREQSMRNLAGDAVAMRSGRRAVLTPLRQDGVRRPHPHGPSPPRERTPFRAKSQALNHL